VVNEGIRHTNEKGGLILGQGEREGGGLLLTLEKLLGKKRGGDFARKSHVTGKRDKKKMRKKGRGDDA